MSGLGISRRQIDGMVAADWLIRMHRGVYAVGHRPATRNGRWMAAVMAGGEGAVLSHRSAAALWGFLDEPFQRPIDVSVPQRRARKSREGIVFHRPEHLARDDATRWLGIPVTTPLRTLFDLTTTEETRTVQRAISSACAQRGVDLTTLSRALVEQEPRTRNRAAMRRILMGHTGSFRSPLEARLFAICRDYGYPRPLVNTKVGGHEADFHWPNHGLIVETDGRTHEFAWQQEWDVARDDHHRRMGITVLRVSYAQATYEPEATAARLAPYLTRPGT